VEVGSNSPRTREEQRERVRGHAGVVPDEDPLPASARTAVAGVSAASAASYFDRVAARMAVNPVLIAIVVGRCRFTPD
jgi:hypothetical protein